MFSIRKAQMEALSRALSEAYVDRVASLLYRFFPRHCQALGEGLEVRAAVGRGIQTAMTHGIENEFDTCQYLVLIFIFGEHLHTPPELDWIGNALDSKSKTRLDVSLIYSEIIDTLVDVGDSGVDIIGISNVAMPATTLAPLLIEIDRHMNGGDYEM